MDLFYPLCCENCGKHIAKQEEAFCLFCESKLPLNNYCLEKENPVFKRIAPRIKIEDATSFLFFRKGGMIQRLMFRLKYRKRTHVGVKLGKLFAVQLKQSQHPVCEAELIIPIPLHYTKERKRGYNQSDFIAEGLSSILNIPIDNKSVIRKVNTDSQTKKGKFDRWENVDGIFEVMDAEKLKGKHLILIDDVITTGSTMEACARALLKIENVRLSVLALASAGK